jgi:hypothetical protein
MLRRYEIGRPTPTPERLDQILDALDVEDSERERLLAMARRHGRPGEVVAGVPSAGRQLSQLIGYERTANRITEVGPLLVPGLLQTADYARAVLGERPGLTRALALRMERAEILTRAEHPVQLRAMLHVEALARLIAPPAVMREQMLHLLRMAELPNVTIQIVTGYAGWWMPTMASPFIVIEFVEADPIVHIEHYRGGAFLWEPEDVRSYAAAADEIARRAMTPARSAEVIAEMEKST